MKTCNMCGKVAKCSVCGRTLCSKVEEVCKIEGYYSLENGPVCTNCIEEVKRDNRFKFKK